MGRPTKYRKEYCSQIIDFMAQGKSLVQFAAEIGVNTDSIHEWRKVHSEFSVSVKKAEKASQAYWENILHRASLGLPFTMNNKEYKSYNTTLIIFLIKSRFRDAYGDQVSFSSDFNFTPLGSLANDDEDEED